VIIPATKVVRVSPIHDRYPNEGIRKLKIAVQSMRIVEALINRYRSAAGRIPSDFAADHLAKAAKWLVVRVLKFVVLGVCVDSGARLREPLSAAG
jgi:hypothetical protein